MRERIVNWWWQQRLHRAPGELLVDIWLASIGVAFGLGLLVGALGRG